MTRRRTHPRSVRTRAVISLSLAMVGCLLLAGCSSAEGQATDPNDGQTVSTNAKKLLSETFDRAQITIDAAGGGRWVWEDGSAWRGPEATGGYFGQGCGTSESNQYWLSINGPAQPNPQSAAARVAEVWRKHGWQVRTVFSSPKKSTGIQIAVDFPAGGGLGYMATGQISGIDVQSECSTDPSMLKPAPGPATVPTPASTSTP